MIENKLIFAIIEMSQKHFPFALQQHRIYQNEWIFQREFIASQKRTQNINRNVLEMGM